MTIPPFFKRRLSRRETEMSYIGPLVRPHTLGAVRRVLASHGTAS